MTRSEYLETIEGQYNERLKREMKIVYLDIKQEPKSKKGISNQEKLFFRQEVKRQLKAMNRRPFRGDIILEIAFYTTQNNPPALHTLSKNYLDLLHKPMPEIDNYKGILFKDDSQIKILISYYHLDDFGKQKPHIMIRAYNLSKFYEDIELADRIINNKFDDSDYFLRSKFKDYSEEDLELDEDSDYFAEIKDLNNRKDFYINNFGEQSYYFQKYLLIQRMQERYLRQNKLELFELISIFESNFSFYKKYANDIKFKEIWDTNRKILLASNFLELGNIPLRKGEKSIFKENLKNKLRIFKKKYKILFPLLQPISVIIIFLPPKYNIPDLDNLARYIVPFVNEILEPPASFQLIYDEKHLGKLFKKNVGLVQRFPQNSIASYQFISIPRKENDPNNGEIKFIITDGLYDKSNIWKIINDLIEKWEETIE